MSEPATDHGVEQLRKQHAAALEATAKAVAMLSDTYRERAFLVALLAAEYPSVWAPDPSAGPGWRVVYVDLPTGQASWHISPNDWDLFGFVPQGDIEIWDGHTTVEKYKRVFDLTMNIHLRKMTAEQPQDDGDVRGACAHCRRDLTGASVYTIQGIAVCADVRHCLARQAEQREQLRDEYGIRADFIDTTSAEFTVAETLDEALEALAEFDAKYAGKVVSRELTVRPVGEWRKVGDPR